MSPAPRFDPPRGKPTLRTVAKMTGFAVATVSRALADDPKIAKSTRATIAEAARKIGYMPDRAARRLRTGRTQVVTLLMNTDHEFLGFTHEFLSGITQGLLGTGYSVNVVPDMLGADRLGPVETILRNRLADGLLFTRTESFDPRVRVLMEAKFPFVSHGRTEFTEQHAWVDYDNEAFARAAVERLIQRGRKRISLIPPAEGYTFAQHIRYGFLSAVRAAGIDHEIAQSVTIDSSSAEITESLRARLTQPDPPDGYVCIGEVIALTTLAVLSDAGVVPGQDVDVIAKRASPIFQSIRPRVDTMFEDVRATGKTMAQLLLRAMDGEPPEKLQHLYQFGPATWQDVGPDGTA